MMARLGGWYRQNPPDGKYLPDEPASFAKSMNSSVKRKLSILPICAACLVDPPVDNLTSSWRLMMRDVFLRI